MSGKISDLRKVKNISQREAAQLLGINQSAVSHIETGRKRPSIDVAIQFAQLLDTTVEELFAPPLSPLTPAPFTNAPLERVEAQAM